MKLRFNLLRSIKKTKANFSTSYLTAISLEFPPYKVFVKVKPVIVYNEATEDIADHIESFSKSKNFP